MEKRGKYVVSYLSRDLIHQKTYPLQNTAFGAECLTFFRILKVVIFCLRNGFL